MVDLRNKLIRLAHARPELRSDLLPLLKKTAGGGDYYDWLADASHSYAKAVLAKVTEGLGVAGTPSRSGGSASLIKWAVDFDLNDVDFDVTIEMDGFEFVYVTVYADGKKVTRESEGLYYSTLTKMAGFAVKAIRKLV